MLETLVDVHRETETAGAPQLVLSLPEAPGGRPDPLAVLGIDSRLVQVFRNLIANAISFSPPGGVIRIAARRAATDRIVVTARSRMTGRAFRRASSRRSSSDSLRRDWPVGEKFGTPLRSRPLPCISKQIVETHRGTIAMREPLQCTDGGRMTERSLHRTLAGRLSRPKGLLLQSNITGP